MSASARTSGGEPNPVAQIIATRTAQVGGAALLALLAARAVLPRDRFRPLVPWGGLAVGGGLSAYFCATFHPRVPLGAPLVTRLLGTAGNAVALTFDDGPHPDTTPRILDLLREHGAKATFFVVGESVARYPELVRRVRAEGHGVGIHGLRHRTMVLQNARAIQADLREAARRIEAAAPGGAPVRLLRPPYGFRSWTLGRVATRLGLQLVAWSLDSRDYRPVTPAHLLERVKTRLAPRDIVLLHERPDAPHTLDALPALLRFCRARGWQCVAL